MDECEDKYGLTPDIKALRRKQEELEKRIAFIEARLGILKQNKENEDA